MATKQKPRQTEKNVKGYKEPERQERDEKRPGCVDGNPGVCCFLCVWVSEGLQPGEREEGRPLALRSPLCPGQRAL
ncbi:hypothetical protein CesoFtcFv8_020045 [Champsocephalus esox]|uniref:Uncharacterized protein n=1 Tax=Champsocephalus esox TaxID=159716 RepID=A0AAN8GNT8_9TELE|nr:hypothetical protein CesoFtcFv8_020045 [Champsocephalus esox]